MIKMISKYFSKLVKNKFFYFVFLMVQFCFLETDASSLDSLLKVNDIRKDDTIKVNRYFELSNKFRNELLDYSKAKSSANKAINLAKQINYHAGFYRGKIALAYVTRDMGNTQLAIGILHSAIQFFNSHHELNTNSNLLISQIYSYTALSELYMHLPDFKNAEKCAMEALKLSEKNSAGLGQCWMTLANIFYNQKNILEARKYALKAQEIFERNNSFDDLARTYSFLGNFEYMENNFAGSIKYYQLALTNYRKINSLIGSRITLYNGSVN
jgi:tetratricopeptide (TPR) repeat protein